MSQPEEQPAATAGEEDHSDPDNFRGEDAEAPEDTGIPALPEVDDGLA